MSQYVSRLWSVLLGRSTPLERELTRLVLQAMHHYNWPERVYERKS